MKFLLLFSTLFPALAFATSPDTPANDADAHGVWGSSFYRGTAVHTRADGTEQQALVALETVRMPSSDHRSAMLFVYHVHKHGKHGVFAFLIKWTGVARFFKVYVPVDASVTETVETALNADATKFREAGWGHAHSYRGHHGYTKTSFFLNYLYTTGDRIDHNIAIKVYDDGSRKLFSHVSGGTDADGLRFVWMDKMKMLPTISN